MVSAGDRGQPKLPAGTFHVGAPPWRSLVDLTRRAPRSRPGSRLTPASPSPAPAPLGPRGATTRRFWPSSSQFARACARPESPSNDRRPPPRRDPRRRRGRLLAPHGRGRGGDGAGGREHREAARPIVAGHGGRIVKTTGDGLLLEFPSVVPAVECAIAIQKLMAERNAATPEAKRIVYRVGVNLGDVLDRGRRHSRRRGQHRGAAGGDLRARRRADLGHGLRPRARQDRRALRRSRRKGPEKHRAASAGLCGQTGSAGAAPAPLPLRGEQAWAAAPLDRRLALRQYRRRPGAGAFRRRGHGEPHDRSFAHSRLVRDRAQHALSPTRASTSI